MPSAGEPTIDLRTEVMTPPSPAMWKAMREKADSITAPFGSDETIQALEAHCATLTGQQSAVLTPTTTMANLLGLQALCAPGEQAIIGAYSHIFWWEDRHIATIGRASLRVLRESPSGELDLDEVGAALAGGPFGFRLRTGVVAIENTHNYWGGAAIAPAYVEELCGLARSFDSAVFVDGARVLNAAVAQGIPVDRLTAGADAVSLSLNKGLGTPYGAVLCGRSEVIESARAALPLIGGSSVHRAGLFAAAALAAFEEEAQVDRIGADHRRAERLARKLDRIERISVKPTAFRTNIVLVEVGPGNAAKAVDRLAALGVLVTARDDASLRIVTHRGFTERSIPKVCRAFEQVARSEGAASVGYEERKR